MRAAATFLSLFVCACGGDSPPRKVSIAGDVFAFMKEVSGPRVSGARISVLEHPEMTATTGADGHFQIDGLDEGSEATLVMEHPDFYPLQSATYTLGPDGIQAFALQAIPNSLFAVLSSVFSDAEQESHCILATTVTRLGGTLHVYIRQGEAGAQLSIAPAATGATGPIYFSESVLPDARLTATTRDGGALYYNVPPGDYVLSAAKPGVTFAPVKMKCRAGTIVNAGPPIGLQADVAAPDWGAARNIAPAAAASDALCDRTAACVNATNGAAAYPDATVASCKATFRRALAFVDPSCDARAGVTAAWRTFLACRASSCELAVGDDTACAAEEQAFDDALRAYAPCYTTASKGL